MHSQPFNATTILSPVFPVASSLSLALLSSISAGALISLLRSSQRK